ncbi:MULTISPECIES: NAD(+) diphosphatase [Brucella]|uniref:NAD(+) diphosphatase n=2 Tax=Brucella suis TaxID=29461 RepID=A0AAI8E6L7_BRUSS|nr:MULTISPECIES: NAD(+) diphosphatase [Brucella]AAN28993.1 MutT/nudix family protein [Brucella suis 1330]AEM17405.1 MutT/nudix family protein [Brucella suis 1330]AEU05073.1 MutT/nudix family protein [Brucella suis VBI22]AHN45704.1 peroxisomal NADH pyrophosphatase NUDT12 [Brucella suis bv. 1 str. S2]AIN83347.1 DNA mismatch repair protein MutT [Brucella suis]
MAFRLYDLPEMEPSRFVGFAGNRIERLSEKRPDDSAFTALELPETRIMILGDHKLLLDYGQEDAPRALFSLEEAHQFVLDLCEPVLLGLQDGTPLVALTATLYPEALPAPFRLQDYRSVYTEGLVPADLLGALAQTAALTAWHESHRFCGRCGTKTEMRAGGAKRLCPQCGAEHFPRTDPVAIMLPVRGEKCILARGPHFVAGSYSCLAGFIEHGETIEAAVRRESFEEMKLAIGRVAYHASQPWPFPYSLMIGCHAEVLSDDFTVDRSELEDGRWFSKAEVRTMLEGTHENGLRVPPCGAIATHLIKAWAYDAG